MFAPAYVLALMEMHRGDIIDTMQHSSDTGPPSRILDISIRRYN
jgi:hypothetical protein